MRLRDVTLDDRALWVRLRCDPVMWTELGGPQSPESIPDKIKADMAAVEAGGPSNGICRSLGFTLVETEDFDYFGQRLRCNHWQIEPTAVARPPAEAS